MKFVDKLNKLFNKVDETEARYQKALEAKEEELLVLKAKLSEKEFMLKDMHKMMLLGDISEATFEAENKKVETLRNKVSAIKQELSLMESYKTEDVKAVLAELEEEHKKLSKEKDKELIILHMQLLEAKLNYLEKLSEVSAEYNKLSSPSYKLQALQQKLGLRNNVYASGAGEALNAISFENGYIPLRVEQNEVYDALAYKRVPSQLKRAVDKAKE
ncbi:hypothetical protein P2R12_23270 [Cytobacillus oceanisediminis]|uniref:hypothetical protein n=1 Tax=Cytobacillus oceanisediminis TaxID=665099 RepID=UPI0023D992EF|nr:hypothetical protein [Cytobacillus oceanisediminis]MDF2039866.1 hypothetical protein [Cytobacillus oceanisediminis]